MFVYVMIHLILDNLLHVVFKNKKEFCYKVKRDVRNNVQNAYDTSKIDHLVILKT